MISSADCPTWPPREGAGGGLLGCHKRGERRCNMGVLCFSSSPFLSPSLPFPLRIPRYESCHMRIFKRLSISVSFCIPNVTCRERVFTVRKNIKVTRDEKQINSQIQEQMPVLGGKSHGASTHSHPHGGPLAARQPIFFARE